MGAGDVVALIAGAGRLPVAVAHGIKARGLVLVTVSVADGDDELAPLADHAYRAAFGEAAGILAILQRHRVTRVVMAGSVARRGLIDSGDALFQQWLRAAGDRRDQPVFHYIAAQMQQRGIAVAGPLEFVPNLVVRPGVLTRRPPSADEQADIALGAAVARTLAGAEVGQTVVIKRGVILAVEAAEGTDATIRRGGQMAPGVVVVKAARPQQDIRFDLPTVGLQTVALLREVGAAVMAVEAGMTLLLDGDSAIAAANEGEIAIIGVEMTGFGVGGSGFGG